ncbi:DnaJ DnaJ-class molecular chaperone with C-terminal Zn finger domain [Pyrenophora tritici-repentis]|uniref:DnaJ, DnaJ-class molecular chaperone with C-terminal Zn finger domain protein n=1 Tax=Pyrenophora tritici-repentis TaxID=45151 RepID=A0A2W1EH63_9PLEO|nr:Chaperone protein dnaJ [Pyrenophora tritici-repentis]KAF7573764.1 DnaJ, DnaJ-class molecular chaperone with C-terminal Zn finger domain protein [Pyrenophora tritici-repentis]KAI1537836.1 DnaJ DnaJ-class molecular chaperone with C-terminal Zn finger domain [Pyrenophora tritici-repentis]KAI1540226.1 DnaJ DnaJ-class molecular chaperone with C-terminal Zn finger domain [Pyrenophora tritici-repentis]KAI1552226.1 DnaJ DnaJ-class molecular chaperone with C-terminal Zn finger domain [Pyrenophora tri
MLRITEVLDIEKGASKTEIKKAYHKAALAHHPDKVAEDDRAEAEIRFKAAKQAYEILSDDDKRHMYDTHGMAAFDPSNGGMGGGGPDMDDIFAQMFGGMGGMGGFGGMPGMGGMGGMPGGRNVPRKGRSVEQEYEVTLEELYKGKTTKFSNTKNIICSLCKGSGGKQGAKSNACAVCNGRGAKQVLRQVGPGLVTQETVACGNCQGSGQVIPEKQRCKKCKGNKVVETKNVLELYIPRGARQGERIVLAGEADQLPDQEPGDIIFTLTEAHHDVFERAGADLRAELKVSLVEALTGFNRVVITHLDGRGLKLHVQQPDGNVLRPGQVLKIQGEGMPMKKSDARGDLYLVVDVEFPEDGWLKNDAAVQKVRDALPKSDMPEEKHEEVEEVEVEWDAEMEDFGAGSGDPRAGGGEWEDDDDEEAGPQCATQ